MAKELLYRISIQGISMYFVEFTCLFLELPGSYNLYNTLADRSINNQSTIEVLEAALYRARKVVYIKAYTHCLAV